MYCSTLRESQASALGSQIKHSTSKFQFVMLKVFSTHLQREVVKDWVCKVFFQIGIQRYFCFWSQTFRARRQLLCEGDWARAFVSLQDHACSSKAHARYESGNEIKVCRQVDKRRDRKLNNSL